MSRTVQEIYEEYKIFPNLQKHMLRVAAVASLICDAMEISVDKENIVVAELFHDMGNIIKSNPSSLPEFFQPEGVEHWMRIKQEFISRYGPDEHHANVAIIKEIGLSERAVFLADQNRFSFICLHKENPDMDVKIMNYSDGRVAPHGVLSYQGRMDEVKKRYGDRLGENLESETLISCGLEIERQIFEKCKIRPEDITDETIASIILELKDFVIK